LLNTNSGGFILANPMAASDPGQPHVHNSIEKAELVNLVKKNESSDFPEPTDGVYSYYGLSIYLLEGENAQKALDFAADTKGKKVDFDPSRQTVLATVESFDEPQLGIYLVDRESKQVAFRAYSNTVDLDPQHAQKQFPNIDEDEAPFQIVGEIARRGELLEHVSNPADLEEGVKTDQLDFASWT